jgi:hypothetical protein
MTTYRQKACGEAFDVALSALSEYQNNWDTGLVQPYAESERIAMECAVEAVRDALNEARTAALESTSPIPGFSEPDGGADVRGERQKAFEMAAQICDDEQSSTGRHLAGKIRELAHEQVESTFPVANSCSQPAAPAEPITKEWCMNMAKLEPEDGDISAGAPSTAAQGATLTDVGGAYDEFCEAWAGSHNHVPSRRDAFENGYAMGLAAAQGATLTDEHRDNFDVHVKELATKYALDRTATGGWIFENHNLFTFVYAALSAYPTAAPTPVADSGVSERRYHSDTPEHQAARRDVGIDPQTTDASELIAALEAEQTFLGSCYKSCDDSGKARWNRLQGVIDFLTAAKPVSVDAGGMTDDPAPVEHALLHWSMVELRAGRNATAETNRGFRAGWQAARETPPTESTGEPK